MCVVVCSWDNVFWLQLCIIVLAGDNDKAEGLSKPFREGPLRRGHCKQWSDPEHLYMCSNRIRVSMCSVRSVITIAIVVGATIAYFNMVWPFFKNGLSNICSVWLCGLLCMCVVVCSRGDGSCNGSCTCSDSGSGNGSCNGSGSGNDSDSGSGMAMTVAMAMTVTMTVELQ